jgi:4-hydroxy-2-oxoheptanedioate aldolase
MTLKDKLAAGRPILGLSLMFDCPPLVEMAGAMGFDWVLLDCEHGALEIGNLEPMIAAAEASGVAPIVRPPSNSPELILRALDRGAAGLQCPHVMNADEARAIVAAAKYHPLGERGLAVGTRSSRYGMRESVPDYIARANRETLVCVQIEHVDALPHIEEIAAVPGVDVVFVGAMDLSQSLGFPGATDAPDVASAVEDALQRIVATGAIAGTSGKPELAKSRLDIGVRYHYTHVTSLLATAARPYLALGPS